MCVERFDIFGLGFPDTDFPVQGGPGVSQRGPQRRAIAVEPISPLIRAFSAHPKTNFRATPLQTSARPRATPCSASYGGR